MPFDFIPQGPTRPTPTPAKRRAGKMAYLSGLAAEDSVARHYQNLGYRVLETRWRGICGEIDLILSGANGFVFVEVKKSRTFDEAAERMTFRQLHRIAKSAEDYVGNHTSDPFVITRLDLAMVNGQGQIKLLENLTLY